MYENRTHAIEDLITRKGRGPGDVTLTRREWDFLISQKVHFTQAGCRQGVTHDYDRDQRIKQLEATIAEQQKIIDNFEKILA